MHSEFLTAQLHVYSNPVSSEHEDEFNDWYSEVHIPEVVRHVDGIVAGRRLVLSSTQVSASDSLPRHRYLTIYDLVTADAEATLAALSRAFADGTLQTTESIDVSVNPPCMLVFDPLA
ncbi:hypothetical protein BH09ACT10_BH09ACT10_25370 [soil metagenome]